LELQFLTAVSSLVLSFLISCRETDHWAGKEGSGERERGRGSQRKLDQETRGKKRRGPVSNFAPFGTLNFETVPGLRNCSFFYSDPPCIPDARYSTGYTLPDAKVYRYLISCTVWFGLVGFSFNASLEPKLRARRRARLAEDAPARNAFWTGRGIPCRMHCIPALLTVYLVGCTVYLAGCIRQGLVS
jgi:hypothetical protein